MRILMAHNYFQHRGGEDICFEEETALLRDHGHTVVTYSEDNHRVGELTRLQLARRTLWNPVSYRRVRALIRESRPELLHCHNYFPLLSPSIYDAAHDEGIPVVQHLHDYRFGCIKGWFFRNDRVCDDCLRSRSLWPGLVHRCYRDSFAASAVSTAMLLFHRRRRTWRNRVDAYIALTEGGRLKFGECGLPIDKILVRPNFLSRDPGLESHERSYALFIGRLSSEKGVQTLLDAWEPIGERLPLKIAGDGPLAPLVRERARSNPGLEWVGFLASPQILALLRRARLMVFPSVWYECLPRVIVEAYAVGTPVVASDLGAMRELVDHGRTGRRFKAGDAAALAGEMEWCLRHPSELVVMGREARAEFESKYAVAPSYQSLIRIYERTAGGYRRGKRDGGSAEVP